MAIRFTQTILNDYARRELPVRIFCGICNQPLTMTVRRQANPITTEGGFDQPDVITLDDVVCDCCKMRWHAGILMSGVNDVVPVGFEDQS